PDRPRAPQRAIPGLVSARTAGKARIGLADGGAPLPLRVREVTTRSLGMIALDQDRSERVVELIPEATPLPARYRGRFVYAYDNMTSVRVEVTEGRGTRRDQVRVIGAVELTGLPPRPRGTPIEIVYLYNDNQILQVELTDLDTGRMKTVDLTFRGALSRPEFDAARDRTSSVHVG
ncbi:MAG TPA: Hsp70 family protein, partial [Myxococcota bacterium]|nr:Hsp70 family protein [Myxococcota bacterium]